MITLFILTRTFIISSLLVGAQVPVARAAPIPSDISLFARLFPQSLVEGHKVPEIEKRQCRGHCMFEDPDSESPPEPTSTPVTEPVAEPGPPTLSPDPVEASPGPVSDIIASLVADIIALKADEAREPEKRQCRGWCMFELPSDDTTASISSELPSSEPIATTTSETTTAPPVSQSTTTPATPDPVESPSEFEDLELLTLELELASAIESEADPLPLDAITDAIEPAVE